MTKKQIKKHAAQIYAWEKLRNDPNTSERQKHDAEQNIISLTNMISSLPHGEGFNILVEIDDIIQHLVAQENSLQDKEN